MKYKVSLLLSLLTALSIFNATSRASAQDRAQVTRTCVNGLLYRNIYRDGSPNGTSRNEDMTPRLAVNSCSGTTADSGGSDTQERDFRIINNTGVAIEALYLSSSLDSSWGSNDINGSLFNNNSVNFNLVGECNWDLRVELSNGQSLEQRDIDTCLNDNYSVGVGGSGAGAKLH